MTEFPVPSPGGAPTGIARGPDDNLWFTERQGNKIGEVTPAGSITEYHLNGSFYQPEGITSGPGGDLWFTEYSNSPDEYAWIGRLHITSGTIEDYFSNSYYPFHEIAAGPDGNLWFTVPQNNVVGRMTPTGSFTYYAIGSNNYNPLSITAGPDGNLWFTATSIVTFPFTAPVPAIGRITTTGDVTVFPLSWYLGIGFAPRGITAGPDGNLWFTEFYVNAIGRITPAAGTITEFAIPTADNTFPMGITAGSDGNVWFAESYGNKIGRLNPADGTVSEFDGLTASSWPLGITAGPAGSLWFTERDGNRIGRLTPDMPLFGDYETPDTNRGLAGRSERTTSIENTVMAGSIRGAWADRLVVESDAHGTEELADPERVSSCLLLKRQAEDVFFDMLGEDLLSGGRQTAFWRSPANEFASLV